MAYLVMEYLPGITLRELLREQRRLTVPQTVTIMDAILSGLAAAHRAGIVHRDVKPENVLLAEDGRIKIGDFGLARATTANTATGAQLLGTIAYLAPELVTRGMADARSDIYSLGIMLYEMLVGEQPYKGEQPMQIAFQHATDSVPRPSAKNPGVPEQLDELVLWATEKSPDDRPNDAKEMLDRLRDRARARDRAAGGPHHLGRHHPGRERGTGDVTQVLPSTMTGPTTAVDDVDNATRLRTATKRRAVRGGWLIALVIVLAALAAGAGWWFGSGPGSQVAVRCRGPKVRGGAADLGGAVAPGGPEGCVRPGGPAGCRRRHRSSCGLAARTRLEHRGPGVAGTGAQGGAGARGHLGGRRPRHPARLNLLVAEPDQEFFTDAAEGAVIAVAIAPQAGGDPVDCTQGCTALEGDTATLSVSVGSVPDVAAGTWSRRQRSSPRSLSVAGTVEEFSEDFDAGEVIYIADREGGGSWRPGDSVTLVVSAGPPLFAVPDIVGLTRDQAKAALTQAGFDYEYATLWDAVLDEITEVESQVRPPAPSIPAARLSASGSTGRSDPRVSACRALQPAGTPAPGTACDSGAGRTALVTCRERRLVDHLRAPRHSVTSSPVSSTWSPRGACRPRDARRRTHAPRRRRRRSDASCSR